MIYLTGQLLFFLLVTAFLGFVMGWLLRGAMLPLSMFQDGGEKFYNKNEHPTDKTPYQFAKQGQGSFAEPERTEG